MSDGRAEEFPLRRRLVQNVDRLHDVELKHTRVRELLASTGADALLLQDPANIAWFTAGADVLRHASENCQTSLFITDDARLFATNSVDSTQIFEREAFGLGFQLKQREWFQPHAALIDDLARSRRVVSDSAVEGTRGASRRIARMRLPLTRLEVIRLRKLSRVLLHAVEVTAGNLRRGMTEAAVAGEIAHRLIKRTVNPVRIQVCADGRNERYRHWGYGGDTIQSSAVICCVARRWGLHAALARTVALGQISSELREAHQRASLMHATGIYFSNQGRMLKEIWAKVRRIYEKSGVADEWQLADQADVMGYRTSEVQLTPESDYELQSPVPMFWHPSVGSAMPGDSILINSQGCERLTHSDRWPQLTVNVKGHEVICPAILRVGTKSSAVLPDVESGIYRDPSFAGLSFEKDDDASAQMDSVWEMEVTSERSVFDDEDDSAFSEESVLD